MEQAMEIFKHEEFGSVRVIERDGEPFFVGRDVAIALGYSKPADAVREHVPDKYKGVCEMETPGGKQNVVIISEAGLYKLVMRSKLPNAEKFSDWVCEDVVPSIRKHGMYMTPKTIDELLANPDLIIRMAQRVKEARAQIAVLNTQVAELQPKATYCDVVLQCKNVVPTSIIAKDYGYSAVAFNKLLNRLKVQYKLNDIWLLYQKYAAQGWSQTKTHVYYDDEGNPHSKPHMYWTQKGRLGLYDLLKRNGFLPMIEQ